MAVAADWFRRVKRKAQPRKQRARAAIDPESRVLLDRRGNRLLRDVGLTRVRVLGEEIYFWTDWAQRAPWNL